MLSAQDKKAYVQSDGRYCPYCRSAELTMGKYDADEGWITFAVTCDECGKEWRDLYVLKGLIEEEEEA